MKALVTGASGFVGPHLVAHLEANGDDVALDPPAGLVDITDAAALRTWFEEIRPEVVYHLAGWADVGGSWNAPEEVFTINATGTLHVLRAAAAVGANRVLLVSSADVYGIVPTEDLPITEEHPLRPVSPYAVSKVTADFLGLQAWLGHNLEVVRVRAFNHLGPGQADKFVAPAIASRIARNELDGGDEIPVGNLSARRDLTDVRDVVRAYRLLVEQGEPGEAYNVCTGVDIAISELAERLLTMAKHPMRLTTDPDRQRPIDVPVLRGDSSRLRQATGWKPEIPLDTTLTDVLADWRARVATGSAAET
ncbi:MAG: GDP-mannose 4,6-dehydratase [Acidimicrobiia bacterium]|nr:GDP-mannose 4,6-dehydratase [Acidimicrobiia bacterium]